MKQSGIIYKITNKINGKAYIGQTIQSLSRRKSEHLHRLKAGNRDHWLYLAFKKYGFDNFSFEVITKCNTHTELNEQEKFFIQKYDTYNNGYNMTYGGDSIGQATREKLSKIHKGRKIPWMYKIVAARKANGTNGHPQPKGCKSPISKKYIVTEPDGTEYYVDGLREWCRNWTKEKIGHGSLSRCATGEYTHTKGYKCRYANDEPSTTIPQGSTPQAIGGGNGQHPEKDEDIVWPAQKCAAA